MKDDTQNISELILMFPINSMSPINIEDLIWSNFINTEEWDRPIEDENKNIIANRKVIDILTFKLPKILILQIGRFNADMTKINKLVNFGFNLNLKDIIQTTDNNIDQKLSFIIRHFGNFQGGH